MLATSPTRSRQSFSPPRSQEIDVHSVRPFGNGGVGVITGHPVGLVVAIGVVAIGLMALPPVRWFFLGSILLGGIAGFVLWLAHR